MGHWNDYPIFLAVAETGSLTAAGRKLGLSQPTVGRRIRALEEEFGMPLVVKDEKGLRPTRFGESILANVRRMREEADAIARTSASLDSKMEGTVRLAATEGIGTEWLPAVMARFREAHPEVRVDMTVGFSEVNLAQREADIALRWGGAGEQNSLFGKRVAAVKFGFYASNAYLERAGCPDSLEALGAHDGVYAMVDSDHPLWLGARMDSATPDHPPGRVTFRTNSYQAFVEAVRLGYGLGFLAVQTGEAMGLTAVLPDAEMEETLWVVAHEDLKRSPRIRAVFDYVAEAASKDAAFFAGDSKSVFA